MTRTSSPILWYGDLVDFGSFEDAVSDNDITRPITFRFGFDEVVVSEQVHILAEGEYFYRQETRHKDIDVEFCISASHNTSQISLISLSTNSGETKYSLSVDSKGNVTGLSLNGRDVLRYFGNIKIVVPQGSIFPEVALLRSDKTKPPASAYWRPSSPLISTALADLITPYVSKKLKRDAVERLSRSLLNLTPFNHEQLSRMAERGTVRSWKKFLSEIASGRATELYEEIKAIVLTSQFVPLLSGVNERLSALVSGVLYIGPARARSERYYRYQDLAVSEIDPDGKNFPMFLNSLREGQLESFSSWVERLYGYRISLSRSAGHISISLLEGQSKTNIVDTGYGVSQILPVLVKYGGLQIGRGITRDMNVVVGIQCPFSLSSSQNYIYILHIKRIWRMP